MVRGIDGRGSAADDGREIVRELDTLRAKGLDRDEQGRYFLKAD